MKKLIFLLLFLFTGIGAYSQVTLVPLLGVSYGTEKYRIRDCWSSKSYTCLFPDIKVTTGLQIAYRCISAMYRTNTWCKKSRGISFDPKETSYEVGVSYEYKGIKASFSHCCFHSVKNGDSVGMGGMYGGWNMVGVSFCPEIHL